MVTPLKLAKTGFAAYRTTKSVYDAVTEPAAWLRAKLFKVLGWALVQAFSRTIGQELAEQATRKLKLTGKTQTFKLNLPVPYTTAVLLKSDMALELVQDIANEVLAQPLEALGYSAVRIGVRFDADKRRLKLTLEVGLRKNDAPEKLTALASRALAGPRPAPTGTFVNQVRLLAPSQASERFNALVTLLGLRRFSRR